MVPSWANRRRSAGGSSPGVGARPGVLARHSNSSRQRCHRPWRASRNVVWESSKQVLQPYSMIALIRFAVVGLTN